MQTGISLHPLAWMVLFTCAVSAVRVSAQERVIPVWPGVAPGSESATQKEVTYLNGTQKMVRNVVTPTLTAYLPAPNKANGTAVVVCPGGGFHFLSWDSEGLEVAKWLQARGVAAFVLKYRTIDTGATAPEFQRHLDILFGRKSADGKEVVQTAAEEAERKAIPALASADGRQAMKVVRQHAVEWGIAPDRIGILGFSAGGAVTMGVMMNADAESRPNFAAPIYGGDTGGAPVPADAPPLFILVANSASEWDFAFIYLGFTDTAGHRYGWMSEPYLRAIGVADRCIAQICASLRSDCHILVTADHGGHGQTHGTDREDDIMTPLLLSGPSIPANHTIERSVRITDIAPTIVRLFDLTPPDAWIGSPITFSPL